MRGDREPSGSITPGAVRPSRQARVRELAGQPHGRGRRFGIVASCFHQPLVDELRAGAVDALLHHGVEEGAIEILRVPGAWEVPLALGELGRRGGLDGLIALAVVIRGDTPHFDYICAEAARGCAEVGLRCHLPVGFGVLTCDTVEQARARAGGSEGNKGWEAAEAALEMVDLYARLREVQPSEQGV